MGHRWTGRPPMAIVTAATRAVEQVWLGSTEEREENALDAHRRLVTSHIGAEQRNRTSTQNAVGV